MDRDRTTRDKPKSRKASCVETLESLIISGEPAIGETLPPERELASRLGASRPVLHEAIVELATRGFVAIEPRHGVRVKDYWREGTLAIFESIILHGNGVFAPEVFEDLAGFRRLIELEAVRLAAARRDPGSIAKLEDVNEREKALPAPARLSRPEIKARAALDTEFHLRLAEASGSRALLLVMHSIEPVYGKLVEKFYSTSPDLARIRRLHGRLVKAIAAGKTEVACRAMETMLGDGARKTFRALACGK